MNQKFDEAYELIIRLLEYDPQMFQVLNFLSIA